MRHLVVNLYIKLNYFFLLSIEASKWELKEARLLTITEENLDQYTLNDVVMPIPGYKVSYPDHEELKKIYIELLQADGLEDGFESLKHSNEFYSLPGDYRQIFVRSSYFCIN